MDKTLLTIVRCLAAVALAFLVPPWVIGVPVIVLSLGVAIAIVRSPQDIDRIAKIIQNLLVPPH